MRIALYLAKSGFGARRKTERLLYDGMVTVNGKVVTDYAYSVSKDDKVKVNGKLAEPNDLVYYLLNKPIGYTSTLSDKHAKKIISELVPDSPPVWPVGRLDRETEGLIILTNDGSLTYRLTHPKFEKKKEYEVVLDSPLNKSEFESLKLGIIIQDNQIKPDHISFDKNIYHITIHSGQNRVVRRMFEHFNKKIVFLRRIHFGTLDLGELKVGEWRYLSKSEIKDLYV